MPLYESSCPRCLITFENYYPKVTNRMKACTECGGKTEKLVSGVAFHDFNQLMKSSEMKPYVTRNIHPDGKPIEIRSHKQLEAECKKYKVQPAFGKESRFG